MHSPDEFGSSSSPDHSDDEDSGWLAQSHFDLDRQPPVSTRPRQPQRRPLSANGFEVSSSRAHFLSSGTRLTEERRVQDSFAPRDVSMSPFGDPFSTEDDDVSGAPPPFLARRGRPLTVDLTHARTGRRLRPVLRLGGGERLGPVHVLVAPDGGRARRVVRQLRRLWRVPHRGRGRGHRCGCGRGRGRGWGDDADGGQLDVRERVERGVGRRLGGGGRGEGGAAGAGGRWGRWARWANDGRVIGGWRLRV